MSDLGRALNKDEKAILRETEILRQINKMLEYQIQLNDNKIQELENEFAILVNSDNEKEQIRSSNARFRTSDGRVVYVDNKCS